MEIHEVVLMNRLNFCSVVKSDVSYRQTPF